MIGAMDSVRMLDQSGLQSFQKVTFKSGYIKEVGNYAIFCKVPFSLYTVVFQLQVFEFVAYSYKLHEHWVSCNGLTSIHFLQLRLFDALEARFLLSKINCMKTLPYNF